MNQFVVVSGLPGSGKTTIGRELARTLGLPLIDKDDLLEELFAEQGVGDAMWRRRLSRESDAGLEARARASDGAVIVSFWHLVGMPADSGTPTAWLDALPGARVHVRCMCPIDLAAERFRLRARHAGHLDRQRPAAALTANFEKLASFPPLALEPVIEIDTSLPVDVHQLAREILRQTQ